MKDYDNVYGIAGGDGPKGKGDDEIKKRHRMEEEDEPHTADNNYGTVGMTGGVEDLDEEIDYYDIDDFDDDDDDEEEDLD